MLRGKGEKRGKERKGKGTEKHCLAEIRFKPFDIAKMCATLHHIEKTKLEIKMNDDDLNDPVPPPPIPTEHLPPQLPKLKGGFTKEGRLFIERAGLPKSADCRFCTSVTEVRVSNDGSLDRDSAAKIYRQGFGCTDHCGHMGEPVYQTVGPFEGLTMLNLCNGNTLFFIEFKDNRPNIKKMVMKNG